MNIQVSTIIPCYNYGRFLSRAVNSVLNQTYQDFEIIIVDDHSTDNTPDIARTFTDERVRYIRQTKNVGQSRNRNTGIQAARGEFIAMLDADDWWNKRYLETVIPHFKNPNVGCVYTSQQGYDEEYNKLELGRTPLSGRITRPLFRNNFIGTPIVFRKSLSGEGYKTDLSPHLNNLGADWWFVLVLSTKCEFVGIPIKLYNYLIHENQITKKQESKRIEGNRIIQRKFLEMYPSFLTKKDIRESKYFSYILEGFYFREFNTLKAFVKYVKAAQMKPFSGTAYKGIAYMILQKLVGYQGKISQPRMWRI